MNYKEWLESKGFVTDEEYKKRLLEDCFSNNHINKRLKEIHEMYEEYCEEKGIAPIYI